MNNSLFLSWLKPNHRFILKKLDFLSLIIFWNLMFHLMPLINKSRLNVDMLMWMMMWMLRSQGKRNLTTLVRVWSNSLLIGRLVVLYCIKWIFLLIFIWLSTLPNSFFNYLWGRVIVEAMMMILGWQPIILSYQLRPGIPRWVLARSSFFY